MQQRPDDKARGETVSTMAEPQGSRVLWAELGLVSLTVLFGMQTIRLLVPGLFWILGGYTGWGSVKLGIVGFLVFLTGFLAGPLRRLVGDRGLIAATAGGLALLRLAMQVWWGEPLFFNLILAMAGTALFVIFLPTCLEDARLHGWPVFSRFILGLLFGLTLDTAINGAFGTYDTVWQAGLVPVVVTLLLVLIQYAAVASLLRIGKTTTAEAAGDRVGELSAPRSLTWLAIGPFLFLQLVAFQNIPLMATLTEWRPPVAFGIVLLAQLAGLFVSTWLMSSARPTLRPWAYSAGIGLVVLLPFPDEQSLLLTVPVLFIGQVLLSLLMVVVLIGIGAGTRKIQHSSICVANAVGMLLLVAFIFAYYAVYDISLPYSSMFLEPIAAFIMTACALSAVAAPSTRMKVGRMAWAVPVTALLLLVFPVVKIITWREPKAVPGNGFPVRVMTYNLHNGFGVRGRLDLEALARVIEDSDPDIVALQEVSRGWLVNGRVDMLTWLSQRLDMPYVFGPTTGPLWGNAILSRYRTVEFSRHQLPPRNLLLSRGFTSAQVDVGSGVQLRFIVTHYHHPATTVLEGDTDIRVVQSEAILDFWGGGALTTILGDFNGQPGDPEIEMLRQGGLVDGAAAAQSLPPPTWPSDNALKRIDYIWVSPDLRVTEVKVPLSTASDHLPVVAVIDR